MTQRDQTSQSGSQQGASSALRSMFSTIAQQWDSIPQGESRGAEDEIRQITSDLISASGRDESQLSDMGDHPQLQSVSSRLPRSVKQAIGRVMHLFDDPSTSSNQRFMQACAAAIPQLTSIMQRCGLQTPASAQSYSTSTPGTSSSGTSGSSSGRHSDR
jgi:hypothetical protein